MGETHEQQKRVFWVFFNFGNISTKLTKNHRIQEKTHRPFLLCFLKGVKRLFI